MDKKTHELILNYNGYFEEETCFASDKINCNGPIIKAHTISEKYLRKISRNGFVISPVGNPFRYEGYNLKEIPIKKTKYFRGFCDHHDKKLFSSFENHDFSGEIQQIRDISFRTLCRDLYEKKCLAKYLRDSNDLKFNKMIRHTNQQLKNFKYLYKGLITNYELFFYCIKTTRIPINAAGTFFPTHTYKNEQIQSSTGKQHGFIYNLITLADHSFIIISTTKSLNNNVESKFLMSLTDLNFNFLINYLIGIFLFNNDIFILDPSWLEQQNYEVEKYILCLLNYQTGRYTEQLHLDKFLNFCSTFKDFKIISVDISHNLCLRPSRKFI